MNDRMIKLFSKKYFFAFFLVLIISQLAAMFSINASTGGLRFSFSIDLMTVLTIVAVGMLYFFAVDAKPVGAGLNTFRIITLVSSILGCIGGGLLMVCASVFPLMNSVFENEQMASQFMENGIDINLFTDGLFNSLAIFFLVTGGLLVLRSAFGIAGINRMARDYNNASHDFPATGSGITVLTIHYVITVVFQVVSVFMTAMLAPSVEALIEFAMQYAPAAGYADISASISAPAWIQTALSGLVVPVMFIIALAMYRKAILAPSDDGDRLISE